MRVTRRSLLAGAAGLIGLSAAGTAGYAAAIEPQTLVVTPYTLKPRGWPAVDLNLQPGSASVTGVLVLNQPVADPLAL